jgi:hypothetical protein
MKRKSLFNFRVYVGINIKLICSAQSTDSKIYEIKYTLIMEQNAATLRTATNKA